MTQTNGQDGSTVRATIGGREFTLACLTVGMLKRIAPQLKLVRLARKDGELPGEGEIVALTDVVHAAAQVVTPELSREEFGAFVDALPWDTGIADLAAAFGSVAVHSGLARTVEGDDASGEAAAP